MPAISWRARVNSVWMRMTSTRERVMVTTLAALCLLAVLIAVAAGDDRCRLRLVQARYGAEHVSCLLGRG